MRTAGIVFGVLAALFVHAAVIAFGGILFMSDDAHTTTRDVELLSEDLEKAKDEDKPKEEPIAPEVLQSDEEPPPNPDEVIKSADITAPTDDAPALDVASLSAIEQALNGQGGAGGGDFGGALTLASGGRIGGTGKAGSEAEEVDSAFSMSEIDQRPRAVHQVAGAYPSEMRSRKVEGVVTMIFIVDNNGRVVNPRVEKSSHIEFEKPALDAVRQWKFEPAIKGGERVSCRMRVPIRFQSR